MKKRLLSIIMCLSMILSLAACGSSDDDNGNSESVSKVDLAEYKGIKVAESTAAVDDEKVEEQIEALLNGLAANEYEDDLKLADGLIANIAFEGKIDGETFEGGSSDSYDIEVGVTNFIDGFIDGLIGHKKGDIVTLNLTFPENYQTTTLAGKDVVFTVTINKVGKIVVPELTDALVKEEYAEYDCETVQDLKDYFKNELYVSQIYDAVWTTIVDDSTVDGYDKARLAELKEENSKYYESMISSSYGVDLATYLEANSMSETDWSDQMEASAQNQLKVISIVNAIADKEDITVSDEEYDKEAAKYVEQYEQYNNVEELQEAYPKSQHLESMLYYKVLEWIAENVDVVPDSEMPTTETPTTTEAPTTTAE